VITVSWILRGIADDPGPVIIDVYVDGEFKTTAQWDDEDNCNDLAFVKIDGVEYGSHAIAVRYNNGDPDKERNFYLDGLMVIPTDAIPSLTNGLPKEPVGVGTQMNDITEPNTWRWSEHYYGLDGIEYILELTDQCSEVPHIYAGGSTSGVTAEYLMKFGGDYSQLVLRGIADDPGPVIMEVYIDGEVKTTAQWDDEDNCNDLAYVKIDGIEYGTHAIAVRYKNGDPEKERNFYLDGLMVISNNEEGIPVFVDDDIQAEVISNPAGTTFILKATDRDGNEGIHRMQQINPKDGNGFIGEDGAVLSGAMELNKEGWNPYDGADCMNCWVHEGPDGVHDEVYHEKWCTEYKTCQFPEDLFLDDRFCQQVDSIHKLTPFEGKEGEIPTWFFDRKGSRNIYMRGINPNMFNMEISIIGYAFGGKRVREDGNPFPVTDPATIANKVSIRNLIIEKYACPGQFGAIGFQDPGDCWIIEKNEVRLNHGAGIIAGSYSVVRENYVHDNGQIGIKASRNIAPGIVENILIEGNRIFFNGKDEIGFNWLWEGGGTKFSKTKNLTVRNNIVLNNRGAGLWTDIDNIGTVYENNIVEDNLDNGIFHEISYDAIIRNNTVRRNGGDTIYRDRRHCYEVEGKIKTGGYFHHAQIMVSSSENVQVYNNLVDAGNHMNGIIVRYDYRDEKGSDKLYKSKNVTVHHNEILVPEGNPYGISGGWINTCDYNTSWHPDPLSATGHNFDFDVYHTANSDEYRWIWENGNGNDQLLSFDGFQGVKQELNGKNISSNKLTFAIEDGSGQPGSSVKINLNLENFEDIAGVQFILRDIPNFISVNDVKTTSRSAGFETAFNEDGTGGAIIILYSKSGNVITPGKGPIVELTMDVSPDAIIGESSQLQLENVILSDPAGVSVSTVTEDGTFNIIGLKGDVNSDGVIDILDLVRTINIILGILPEPTETELYQADCNNDNMVDILDVIIILNLIPESSQEKSGLLAEFTSDNTIELEYDDFYSGESNDIFVQANFSEEVAGVQMRFSYDAEKLEIGEPTAEERSSTMSVSTYFGNGEFIVLIYSLDGTDIKPGEGRILKIPVILKADNKEKSFLQLEEIILANPFAQKIPVSLITGNNIYNNSLPENFVLLQNYPNPFIRETFIKYELPYTGKVILKIYNSLGAEIRILVSEHQIPGSYLIKWNRLDDNSVHVPAGMYIYELNVIDKYIKRGKMVVLE
jgi:hypothetical protein